LRRKSIKRGLLNRTKGVPACYSAFSLGRTVAITDNARLSGSFAVAAKVAVPELIQQQTQGTAPRNDPL
jgi:hypothetical protein